MNNVIRRIFYVISVCFIGATVGYLTSLAFLAWEIDPESATAIGSVTSFVVIGVSAWLYIVFDSFIFTVGAVGIWSAVALTGISLLGFAASEEMVVLIIVGIVFTAMIFFFGYLGTKELLKRFDGR